MNKLNLKLSLLSIALSLIGCSTIKPPEYVDLNLPSQYREQASNLDGAWKSANPSENIERGKWWLQFNNPELNYLIEEATKSSPTLAIALERVKQARAEANIVDSSRNFKLDGGFGPTRQRDSNTPANTEWRAQVNASYEVDLLGRLSDESRAAKLDAKAQEAAYRSILLTLQADIAQSYFALRSLDSELGILQKTIILRKEELKLVQHRYDFGDTGELDLARAQTELFAVQAEDENVKRERAKQDHALSTLLGKYPADFTLPQTPFLESTLKVPPGLPSQLLERRPDIVQAQQQLASASAKIGSAKAAFFPKIVLTGTAGYESNELKDIFKWSSNSWLLGPLVGTVLTLPIFDGGRNKANLARADANYQIQVENYRQQVLIGFQEVEDSLSGLRTLDAQISFHKAAIGSANVAERLADTRYKNGLTSYFELIDAQRSRLSAERLKVKSDGERAVASVALIRALGGGWSQESIIETIN
jgi:outer membrane protein, multidrug efflux system